jgi:hypothetical protein
VSPALALSMWHPGRHARGGIRKAARPSKSRPVRQCGSTQARPLKMPSIRRGSLLAGPRRHQGNPHHYKNLRYGSKRLPSRRPAAQTPLANETDRPLVLSGRRLSAWSERDSNCRSVSGWDRLGFGRLEARSRQKGHNHNSPDRFWSDPQRYEAVLGVARPRAPPGANTCSSASSASVEICRDL